ncbi:hypothetical protein MHK_005811 [Candidatus Magnetomorum sp. HK-1]|nr:hypothetical protein MHK_005811 [Candidatus Magnetomorum sp. HK-1]
MAGIGGSNGHSGDGGPATSATFECPYGIASDIILQSTSDKRITGKVHDNGVPQAGIQVNTYSEKLSFGLSTLADEKGVYKLSGFMLRIPLCCEFLYTLLYFLNSHGNNHE